MGRGMALPWSNTEERKDFWLLSCRQGKKVLPMRKRNPQNRRTIERHGDVAFDGDSLRPSPDVRDRNRSCCKQRWAAPTKSCLQLHLPQIIWLSLVWECFKSAGFSVQTYLGRAGWATKKLFCFSPQSNWWQHICSLHAKLKVVTILIACTHCSCDYLI